MRWIRPNTRWAIYVRDGATREGVPCRWCRELTQEPQLDHLVPRKYGGSNDPSNLASSCRKCNRARGSDMHLEPSPPLLPAHRTRGMVLAISGWAEANREPYPTGIEHFHDGCLPWDGPWD